MTLDEFLARRESDVRLARLTHDFALPRPTGLEIGPGDSPLPLPDGFVEGYIDYKPRDALSSLPAGIPHIVWSGAGELAPLCPRADYDFVVAVQVTQYVPNLLGWFRGIYDVLRPGGVLNLTLPDRRFTFDVMRKPSTLGELLEAFHADYARPSLRQVFDHTHLAVAATSEQLWDGETAIGALSPPLRRIRASACQRGASQGTGAGRLHRMPLLGDQSDYVPGTRRRCKPARIVSIRHQPIRRDRAKKL